MNLTDIFHIFLICFVYIIYISISSLEINNGTKYFNTNAIDGQKCYNSSDCVGGRSLRFCNHDYNIFGYCEDCSSIETTCATEEFLCENGEKSCNETCINHGIKNLLVCF